MVSDRQNINKEINQIQGSIIVLDEQISSKTKTIEELKPRVEVAKQIIAMQTKVANLRQMAALLERIKELQSKQKELNEKSETYLKTLDTICTYVYALQNSYEKYSIYSTTLKRIQDFTDRINQNDQRLSKYKVTYDLLEKVSKINLEPLIKVRNSIQTLQSKIDILSSKKSKTIDINTKNIEDNLLKLTNMKTSLSNITRQSYYKEQKENGIIFVNQILDKVTELQSNIKVCPYCGQAIHNI